MSPLSATRPLFTAAAALCAAAALLICATPASAVRVPTGAERKAVLEALDFPPDSKELYRFRVRISTADSDWAKVAILARPGKEMIAQSGAASLKRRNGRWRVHQVGNGGGCNLPPRVARDLQLACH